MTESFTTNLLNDKKKMIPVSRAKGDAKKLKEVAKSMKHGNH